MVSIYINPLTGQLKFVSKCSKCSQPKDLPFTQTKCLNFQFYHPSRDNIMGKKKKKTSAESYVFKRVLYRSSDTVNNIINSCRVFIGLCVISDNNNNYCHAHDTVLTLYSQQPRALYERRAGVVGRIGAGRDGVLALRRRLLLVLRIFCPAGQPAVVVGGRPRLTPLAGFSVTRFVRFDGHERQHAGRRIPVGRRLWTEYNRHTINRPF